jgi:predicted DCC family thiol-disulfide oxidoreductase YuxK
VNAEITDIKNENGWVCFDAECGLCASLARRFGPLLHRHGFALLPLQTLCVKDRLANTGEELLSEMRLIHAQGRVHGGADALAEIARHIWWAKPVHWLSHVSLVNSVFRSGYEWVARNRTCLVGSCAVKGRKPRVVASALGWVAALLPALLALGFGRALPGWLWMWTIALALFLGAKLITILNFLRTGHTAGPRLLAYAFLWPGMDARAFCSNNLVQPPVVREWALAATKTLIGAAVVRFGVRLPGATNPLITGWVGMIGIVLLLHFGIFHLLSLLWRVRGINAHPIMQSPATATSLSGFWGGRWNAGFSDLMRENVFTPLSRRVGAGPALFLIFIISGALHELVISVPARGGYGLPTAYFLIQGLAVLFEHSEPGRKLGLASGFRGWCFVGLVVGLPAFWLFHPVFIHRVILPMFHAIGST